MYKLLYGNIDTYMQTNRSDYHNNYICKVNEIIKVCSVYNGWPPSAIIENFIREFSRNEPFRANYHTRLTY